LTAKGEKELSSVL
jgi:RNA polymerase nonessential primary-like sigma factor